MTSLRRSRAAHLAVLLLAGLTGCGGSSVDADDEAQAEAALLKRQHLSVAIGGNHPAPKNHTLIVSAKTLRDAHEPLTLFTSGGADHTHAVTLRVEDLDNIRAGAAVTVGSIATPDPVLGLFHSHAVTFQLH